MTLQPLPGTGGHFLREAMLRAGEKMQKKRRISVLTWSLCQIWLTLHQQEEQLAVWPAIANIVPRLRRHAHL